MKIRYLFLASLIASSPVVFASADSAIPPRKVVTPKVVESTPSLQVPQLPASGDYTQQIETSSKGECKFFMEGRVMASLKASKKRIDSLFSGETVVQNKKGFFPLTMELVVGGKYVQRKYDIYGGVFGSYGIEDLGTVQLKKLDVIKGNVSVKSSSLGFGGIVGVSYNLSDSIILGLSGQVGGEKASFTVSSKELTPEGEGMILHVDTSTTPPTSSTTCQNADPVKIWSGQETSKVKTKIQLTYGGNVHIGYKNNFVNFCIFAGARSTPKVPEINLVAKGSDFASNCLNKDMTDAKAIDAITKNPLFASSDNYKFGGGKQSLRIVAGVSVQVSY